MRFVVNKYAKFAAVFEQGNLKMADRQSRLDRVKHIIETNEVGNQEELSAFLQHEGISVTQSSLSRDLKLLKVVKGISAHGKSIYMMPDNPYYKRVREHRDVRMAAAGRLLSVRYTGDIAVIKCRPGYASGIASDIDVADLPQVIGTIAGDDTIFVALAEQTSKQAFEANLHLLINS